MKHQRLIVSCICVLTLSVHAGCARFPNFPSADDYRVVVGSSDDTVDDDIDDDVAVPLQMTHLRVRSEIALRYARTAVIVKMYNPSKRPQEATFNVLLPESAFISGFTMTVGKVTYDAYVKEKEEAKKIYNDAVSNKTSAAHVATKARDSNQIQMKSNVEGKTNITFLLTYEELLVRRNGMYNHVINMHPGMPVPKMDVIVRIKESQKISVLRVPELRTGNEIDATSNDAQYSKAIIQRGRGDREATITFAPDLEEQRRLAEIYAKKTKQPGDVDSSYIGYESTEETKEKEGLLGQFVVQYDVDQPKDGELLVNDGYFVHLFAPKALQPLNKHVVFVLDTSGSMWGTKIEQLQKAMDAILSDLHPRDYFHIVEFNTDVTVHTLREHLHLSSAGNPWPATLATPENVAEAKILISTLQPYGGTNIYDALEMALNLIQKEDYNEATAHSSDTAVADGNKGIEDNKNVLEPIIIFLTDGEPTAGETSPDRIVMEITEKNRSAKRTPLFSLAFGESADRVFLRKLSLRNDGFMRQIYEASDAALQLHDFYRQVSSPLLSNVTFLYPSRQIKEGSVSRHQFRTLNDGSEVAVVGKIADGANEITAEIRALKSDGDGRGRELYKVTPKVPVTRGKNEYLPLERVWAYLTIKQLLDKHDAGDDGLDTESVDSEESPEKKALAIALKYSFVTSLTSLVVVRLNKTDAVEPVDAEAVDESKFLPYCSSPAVRKTYTTFSSGNDLSVDSSDGPILYIKSTKRFNIGSYGYGGSGHIGAYGRPAYGYGYVHHFGSHTSGGWGGSSGKRGSWGGSSGNSGSWGSFNRNKGSWGGSSGNSGSWGGSSGNSGSWGGSSGNKGIWGGSSGNNGSWDSSSGNSGSWGGSNRNTGSWGGSSGNSGSWGGSSGNSSSWGGSSENKGIWGGSSGNNGSWGGSSGNSGSWGGSSGNSGGGVVLSSSSGSSSESSVSPSAPNIAQGFGNSNVSFDNNKKISGWGLITEMTVGTDLNQYYLEAFEWTSSLLDNVNDSLVFEEKESKVILKLSTDINPPRAAGDLACASRTPAEAGPADGYVGEVCVYLTRCFTARSITVDEYRNTYCIVNDGFAGVCCPTTDVDRTS